eukprot:gene11459-11605_t
MAAAGAKQCCVLWFLQQWVNEAARHSPGLKVVVYDGLKWQRAQAEAESKKKMGRYQVPVSPLLQACPFNSPAVFKAAIAQPFARSVAAAEAAVAAPLPPPGRQQQRRYGWAEREGVRRLLALLQPLMWRSNKKTSALDHPLPPRQGQEEDEGGSRKGRGGNGGGDLDAQLEQLAAGQLLQLRLACLHPQLTRCGVADALRVSFQLDVMTAVLVVAVLVGEHGIAALLPGGSSSSEAEALGDIAGGDATWRAWKHVGLHTAQLLVGLCSDMGLESGVLLYKTDVTKKRSELMETATNKVTLAQGKLTDLQNKVADLAQDLSCTWGAAVAGGVPLPIMTDYDDATAWLSSMRDKVTEAKAADEASRLQHTDASGSSTTILLGEHVPKVLEQLEAAAASDNEYIPSEDEQEDAADHELHSEDDDEVGLGRRIGRRTGAPAGPSGGPAAAAAGSKGNPIAAAVSAFVAGSHLHKGSNGSDAVTNPTDRSAYRSSYEAAAANAASYEFLDCLPERRAESVLRTFLRRIERKDQAYQKLASASDKSIQELRKSVTELIKKVSLAGSGLHDPEIAPPEGPSLRDVKLTGTWMTKLEALLRRLLLMRSCEPACKALVFSQFPEVLALASKALDVVQVKHVSLGLGGGKDRRLAVRSAIKSFTEDPDVAVFLLSLKAGAAGLTLTAASRVYLLEPGLDPAIEQQAVARVHRIGQEREVLITRLLVQGSVEEQVLAISEAKQALLSESAMQQQQHHHLHHKSNLYHPEPPQGGLQAAGPSPVALAEHGTDRAAAAAADDDDDVELVGGLKGQGRPLAAPGQGGTGGSSFKRRRSGSGSGSYDGGGVNVGGGGALLFDGSGDGLLGGSGDLEAPTTLPGVAPRREAVGSAEVVGLLEAVMKQRKSKSGVK